MLSVFGVTNLDDGPVANPGDLAGSLRQAIFDANNHAGDDTITFSSDLTGGIITLTNGELAITDAEGTTTITGLGADQLTISGGDNSRVFRVGTNATVEVDGVSIVNGHSSNDGGGIYNWGILTVAECTISDNYGSYGGGIFNDGTLTIMGSTLSNNSASCGGGIHNYYSGTSTITNCTFSGNSAGLGAGIDNRNTLIVASGTIAGNSANLGGGIYSSAATTLTNTIVAGNSGVTSPDIDGIVTASYCIIEDPTGATISGLNNILDEDPQLGMLGEHGGPTQTIPLLPGSVAIDHGNNDLIPSGVTTDQRGCARIVNGTVDIGASESRPPIIVTMATDVLDANDGLTSLREAVNDANQKVGDDTITFDSTLNGQTIAVTLGELLVTDTAGTTTIVGLGSDQLIISGYDSRVFHIRSHVSVEISALTITQDEAAQTFGGGIDNQGMLQIANCNISHNSADFGGGINNAGELTIINSTLYENLAGTYGGAILNSGTLTLTNSTLSKNVAFGGGGIYSSYLATLRILNCTLFLNSANSRGGGIYDRGTLAITGSTIVRNVASVGGGIYNSDASSLANTIIAGNGGNTTSPDINGTAIAECCLVGENTGSNLAEAPVGSPDAGGNLIGGPIHGAIDAMLGTLSDNGGTTETIPLLPDSPAIDMGSNALIPTGVTTDQRGYARIVSGTVDMGAYEFPGDDATPPTLTIGFPVDGAVYGLTSWTDLLEGTATDTGGAGLWKIEVSIRQGTGDYWDGDGFDSEGEVFLVAEGTESWTMDFPDDNFPSDGEYTVHARATDLAGNVETSPTATFTYDATPPAAPVVTRPAEPVVVDADTYRIDGTAELNSLVTVYLDVNNNGQVDDGEAAVGQQQLSGFDSDGIVTTPIGSSGDTGRSVVVQTDGKIIVAGYAYNGTDYDFALVRYNADGSLDTSFDDDGIVITPIGPGNDYAHSVALQADGKILVAGSSFNGSNDDFALVRYDEYGSLDPGFGSGGIVTTPIRDSDDVGLCVAVQVDNKILVAGYSSSDTDRDIALIRYDENGSLDLGFGSEGIAITPIGDGDDVGYSLAVQTDRNIVVGGYASNGSNTDFALVRYDENGLLDPNFGEDGKVTTSLILRTLKGYSVALQTDGKIVLAGVYEIPGYIFPSGDPDIRFAAARYDADGSLDVSFSGDGIATSSIGSGNEYGQSVAVQADGSVLVAGFAWVDGNGYDFAVVRYDACGSLDASFDGDGVVTTPIGTHPIGARYDYGSGAAIQADGKILVAGRCCAVPPDYDFALVRYNADGSLDDGAHFSIAVSLAQDVENNFLVVATDAAGNVSSAADVPTITEDSAPTAISLFPNGVDENQPAGTLVGSFSTTDLTPGDSFTYALVAGDGDVDNASFEIVGHQLRTTAAFDCETKSSYSIRVRTSDAAGLWYEQGFTIAVNDVNEVPPVDFNVLSVSSYDTDQPGGETIEDDGAALRISGNHWKKIEFPYEVTPNTIVEFDFQSSAEGEIHAIGFDTDNTLNDTDAARFFELYGTQTWGLQAFRDYASSSPAVEHYVIPAGRWFQGTMSYLVLATDDDADASGESLFSNIRVYEPILTTEVQGVSQSRLVTAFSTQDVVTQALSLADDFQQLQFSGNAWKKIALDYDVTANTVLEFDFQSSAQGEIQGIGFDNDEVLSDQTFFQLFGTQTWGKQAYRNYAAAAGTMKHYAIPVGKYFTGAMSYLVFGGDDDANAAAEVVFSNIRLYEPTLAVETQGVSDSYLVTSYGAEDLTQRLLSLDDIAPAADGFQTLQFAGNSWKKIDLGYTITANTVLEFDFQSTAQGEIQGIGFDSDQTLSTATFFQLYGTQTWGKQAYRNYAASAGEVVHYVIPVGQYFQGDLPYLVLSCDDDADASGEVTFSNLRIYEPKLTVEVQGVSESLGISSYADQDVLVQRLSMEDATPGTDGFQTLHFAGNAWKKVALDSAYTVTANTILEFDFQSSVQGEIQGIGFDNDEVLSDQTFFQLYGTQKWGLQAYRNYAASAGETVHYAIPVGEFFSGAMSYLIFAGDDDSHALAENWFSNIRLYEGESEAPLMVSAGLLADQASLANENTTLESRLASDQASPSGQSIAASIDPFLLDSLLSRDGRTSLKPMAARRTLGPWEVEPTEPESSARSAVGVLAGR